MIQRKGLVAAVSRLFCGSYWIGLLRALNFLVYDGVGLDMARIGTGLRLSPTISIRNGIRLTISSCANVAGTILIGENSLLSPGMFVTASNYKFDVGDGPVMDLPKRKVDVRIGAYISLAARVVVLPGVTIKDRTVVVGGVMVANDLPASVLATCVPASVFRERGGRT